MLLQIPEKAHIHNEFF